MDEIDRNAGTGRRGFLKTLAAAGGLSTLEAQQTSSGAHSPGQPGEMAEAAARPAVEYPRTFTGPKLARIAFPLGGVAAGGLALGGRGQLCDWQIFNRPDKGRSVSYAFPSIWARAGSAKPVARVLEARLTAPYDSGFGLSPNQVSGLTRLEGATFTGEYPLARVAFHDRDLPVAVSLEAFTPVIPLAADDSGLPVAVLRYTVANPGKETARVAIAFSLENPVGMDLRGGRNSDSTAAKRACEYRAGAAIAGLYLANPALASDDPLAGSMALCVLDAAQGKLSYLRGWPRAKWWASPLLFWDDFGEDGELGPEAAERDSVGSICLQQDIAAGAKAIYTFLLAWHFPNRTAEWCGWQSSNEADRKAVIGNYYSHRFTDAWDAATHAATHLSALERRMHHFLDAMRATTIPAAVKDAAMANLSTLATPTCFRTADGKFRGFEGIGDDSGCCHGNCTHVWNYETTTQFVFPELARSMRESAFDLAEKLKGVLPIRADLPEGHQSGGTTAADGTMGQIVKAYLDWQLSGDRDWLARLWPKVKRALEFAWIEGGWDGDRDGVMEGVQHNTYDVEFYGPNPMCGIYYLGALRACEEMARAMGDSAFADACRRLSASGKAWIDGHLFNGEYYIQQIRGIPRERIAAPFRAGMGAEDPEHPDFQLGEGCLADQLIGQYLADLAGLGPLVDAAHIRKTLESIHKYNYRSSLVHHDSVQRIYALNDEAAVLICDYGKVTRPKIPFPYYQEAWTGIEYLYATQLLQAGMVREGAEIFEDVRRRYDGERRNPWDEPECGHHYARAMSAWSGVATLSGFRYRGAEQAVTVRPRLRAEEFSSFWSAGNAWGVFHLSTHDRPRLRIEVREGTLRCRSVEAGMPVARGAKTSVRLGQKEQVHELRGADGIAAFSFPETMTVAEGEQLVLEG